MRAMVLRRNQQLAIEELDVPRPEPGWVLVRLRACGICGSDLHVARYADEMQRAGNGEGRAATTMDLDRGVVMGHEWVAEVVETGPDAPRWAPGTRVTLLPSPTLPGLPRPRQGP